MKKYICLAVALLLCLSLFGCSSRTQQAEETTEPTATEETTQPVSEKNITLGYYEEKSLNPLITDSPTNRNITTLVYDPLYILDKSYSPVAVIAESSERSENTLTVKIRSGLQFSSGVTLTSYDVVYSFNEAKQSSYYGSRLQNISHATPLSDSVVFTLTEADTYCESVLTFPIVQSGTGENDFPIGSGRYIVQQSSEGIVLKANENNSRGEVLSCEKVRLTPVSSQESELYLLQSGDLSYFFDNLDDGEYTKIGANTIQTSLNNMVFIGLNSASPILSDEYVKNAVTSAINPKAISDSVFSGMCRYAVMPFNPDWYALNTLSFEPESASTARAQEFLEQGNYVYAYDNNAYRSKDFEYLVLRLIVNKESSERVHCAEYIHNTLEAIGIDVELSSLSYDEYVAALEKGEYDLYLGEVRLSGNMDLSCFFSENGSLSYGIDTASTVVASYKDFKAGTTDISTFAQVFDLAKPFIPICFKDGMAYFSREFSFEGDITEYEPFLNAYSWKIIY